jgi:hypothetical protein
LPCQSYAFGDLAIRSPPWSVKGKIGVEHHMTDLPVACSLTPEALKARKEGLLSELLRGSAGHELLADGLRIRFAPSGETLATIARAVDAERHCCRFLRFTVTVEPDEGPLTLDLTGPQGTRQFVTALLDM